MICVGKTLAVMFKLWVQTTSALLPLQTWRKTVLLP